MLLGGRGGERRWVGGAGSEPEDRQYHFTWHDGGVPTFHKLEFPPLMLRSGRGFARGEFSAK